MANEAQLDLVGAYKQYTDDVKRKIKAAENRIGRSMLDEIIKNSNISKGRKSSGRYQKGWRLKKIEKADRYTLMAYNATDAPLTHLLDLGHEMPGDRKKYEGNSHITNAQKAALAERDREINNILNS